VLNLSTYEPSSQELKLIDDFEQIIANTEVIERNALLYIAGYVAHRFRNEFSELGIPTKDLPNPQPNDLALHAFTGKLYIPLCKFSRSSWYNGERIS